MMRWLIALGVLGAIVLAEMLLNPVFWSLVRMETSAEAVTYGNADGTAQQALLGPKAPWPEWAVKPDNSELRVQGWFSATPTQSESGFGYLVTDTSHDEAVAVYKAKLIAQGWTTETSYLDTLSGELPPAPMRLCFLQAQKDGRVIQLSMEKRKGARPGQLHWRIGPLTPMVGATPGDC